MSDQAPLVTTILGPVRGERLTTGDRFLNIPYAQPPVGDLRFAAPVPPEPWTEPLDATAYGPTAQRRPFADVTTIPEPTIEGEGILNLNVFTPRAESVSDGGLPVLVWIHGGGYVAGSAASPWYDGTTFNRDGVLLVSLGYRLGIEGFLHLDDAPDNRGVRDWIAALEWVRDNIAAFGGDPAKVTIAGQSAGGGAVQTLLATPAAQHLFRAAISVSGAVMEPQGKTAGHAIADLFTARTGVPATAAALRDVAHDRLYDFQDALNAPGEDRASHPDVPEGMLLLAPFADGELIPLPVTGALTEGSAGTDGKPLMLGFTRDEFHAMGEIGPMLTDVIFRRPNLTIAEGRAARELPTWFYEFRWESAAEGPFAGQSFHCLDLPFSFDILDGENVTDVAGPNPPQPLADAMHAAWLGFVRDLDPGADWPRYTREQRATRVWDTEPTTVDDALKTERESWLG
ncbi:carboxylic ester hydrolase [Streptomyces spiroverticillatus]|uniref:Carboxylic ester hydrolase n=1 Tax=Streptomyces finlayi TaxID=67296 RepID=A0A918WYK7_9ACTN|nr:carboxylesterase family protein [Streptomyces finlayi]GHA11192.1 carboxylic ester hydrolase [Streptomyces spiroverticillatus]GHC95128.1 carboxylic ester hydrolase [Streptomyces finlayi]